MDLALIGEVITTVALVGLAAVVYVQETRIRAVEQTTGLKIGTISSAGKPVTSPVTPDPEPERSAAAWKGRVASDRPTRRAAASSL